MKVTEIVTRVRAAIDELTQDGTDFENKTEDELNLTRIIIDKIGYALQHIIEHAPLEKLDSDMFEELTAEELADSFSIDTADAESMVAKVKLPKDLLRIVEARLSSWSQFPVPEPDTSQVYLMQQDKYARGSWDRPVTILTWHGSDKYLEMYCAKTANDTLNFTFIRKPKVEDIPASGKDEHGEEIEISVPSQLQASLIYQVAGLTMVAFREDIAASLFAIAQRYLDPEQSNRQSE